MQTSVLDIVATNIPPSVKDSVTNISKPYSC